MAIVRFGNVPVDMRLEEESYGVAALEAFDVFVPVRREVLQQTDTLIVVRVYNPDNESLTITAQGDLNAQQVSFGTVEANGVMFDFSGDLHLDAAGGIAGTVTEVSAHLSNGSLLYSVSGLSVPFGGSTLPDVSDATVLAGSDVITAGTGNDYLLGYGGADSISGNAGADVLSGGTGADTLSGGAGNDTLMGGPGADSLAGNAGNDTYTMDASDSLADAGGIDTVRASFSYELPSGFENLLLLGGSALNGTGNAQANAITGNVAANALSGVAGADTLSGGAGMDTLVGGIGADLLAGGGGPDTLDGKADADTLAGGTGRDTLTGGVGADVFVFNTALNASTNVDTIVGFSVVNDLMRLDADVFNAIALGALDATAFRSGAGARMAQDADDRIVCNSSTGRLFYDADGAGGAAATLFAILDGASEIGAANFFIVT